MIDDWQTMEYTDTFRVSVKAGQTNLLRVINAAMNTDLFFSVANHTMTVVAVDALYTKPLQTNFLMLGPGQTTDVLIAAEQSIGRYYMAAGKLTTWLLVSLTSLIMAIKRSRF